MATEPKDIRKLNLSAPLLSTRRPNGPIIQSNSQAASGDSNNRVPFAWELSAGKPKDMETDQPIVDFPVPTPQPPPGWKLVENEDDGNDVFSDAIDTFSLSAAIDLVESTETAKRNSRMLDGVSLDSGGNQSPGFIIQRFLTDAKALAISSGLPIPKNISNQPENYKPQIMDNSHKGCGLGFHGLFPWRTKHKPPCSVKSPVRVTSASVKSQWKWKPKPK
ncbi:uncharacterized protein [Rutidosis leptorrhynchoides]|uniref:uncharacterized protein n=1 Tax=Rutidosis leptorrhynchoides TaxID=125765 RepID=UPI003A9A5B53